MTVIRDILFAAALLSPMNLAAQSQDIIFLDMGVDDPLDAGAADVDAADADAPNNAGDSGIIIEGIVDSLPEPVRPPPPPKNDRETYEEVVTEHAKMCVRKHAVDDVNMRVKFVYDFDEMTALATLARTDDTADILVPWFHVALLQSVGDSTAINVAAEHRAFEKCANNVPLPSPVQVSERMTFRIVMGSKKLGVRELAWSEKPRPEGS